MFGNLKNKLGDVADLKRYASPQILNSLTGSRQRSTQHSPGLQTPSLSQHSLQVSDSSLPGGASASLAISHIGQNEILHNIKGSENLENELEKLHQSASETEQDAVLQRLNAKEQEWKHKLRQEQKRISKLEEELTLSRNNEAALQKKLIESEHVCSITQERISHKEEAEEKLINLQENYDQLEGLGIQEIAKVKHLLLNATSELQRTKNKLEEKSNEVLNLEKRLLTLQGIEERVIVLSEEKMDLETMVAGLNQKLNGLQNRLKTISEENEEVVNHLEERIAILNQRHSQDSMEDTEKDQAIIQERESYEHKLEETRQQLSNIKSSWSEKITGLETQIRNLNEKIAEDQNDLKITEEINDSLRKEVEALRREVILKEDDHRIEVKSFNDELIRIKEDLESAKWQLDSETRKREAEADELRTSLLSQEKISKQLEEESNSRKEEILSLEKILSEKQITCSELKSRLTELDENCSSLSSSNDALQEQLNRERKSLESVSQELKVNLEKYDVVCSEKIKLSTNLDKYLDEVNGYKMSIKNLQSEKDSLEDQVHNLLTSLEISKTENKLLQLNIKELETDFDSKVERSDLVQTLRKRLKEFEDETLEKKQMIKVQSQRLADLKKTIQRELKINPDTTEGFPDVAGGNCSVSSRLAAETQRPENEAFLLKMKQQNSIESQIGDVVFDPVNLEYLKHVVIKFITSREYEAVQLTRAVSTLLHMSVEEENLLRETLEWKMSWFGPKPNIGKGQMAKAIPPSQ